MLPGHLPCTRVEPGPLIGAPSELVSEGSILGGRSVAPPPWLMLSWASRASLSRHELLLSPPDMHPSLLGVSRWPRRGEGPRAFPLLRRPRLPVRSSSPGILCSSVCSPQLFPDSRLSVGPRRCELPRLSCDVSVSALLQRWLPSPVGFLWPPVVPLPPVASSSVAGLVLRALPRTGLRSRLGAQSPLADPDSLSAEAGLPGRARR